MIEVNYNEYKETLAENMKLIVENGRLNKALLDIKEYIEEHMMEVAKRKGINGEENGAIYVAVADLLEILDKEKE